MHKIFKNLSKFWTNERDTGKTVTNLLEFDKVLLFLHVSMSSLMNVSAQDFQSEYFDCAKEFALKKSGELSGCESTIVNKF